MSKIDRIFLLGTIIIVAIYAVLIFHNEKACSDRGGVMIYRLFMCVKSDGMISQGLWQ